MKQKIEWHEDSVKNMKSYLERLKIERDSINFKVDELDRSIRLREEQVLLAKKRGKDSFDADKFGLRKLIVGKRKFK